MLVYQRVNCQHLFRFVSERCWYDCLMRPLWYSTWMSIPVDLCQEESSPTMAERFILYTYIYIYCTYILYMHRFIFWGSYPMGKCTLVSLIFVSHSHDPIGGATYDASGKHCCGSAVAMVLPISRHRPWGAKGNRVVRKIPWKGRFIFIFFYHNPIFIVYIHIYIYVYIYICIYKLE